MRRLSLLLVSAVMALTLIAFAVATGASAGASAQQQDQLFQAVYEGDKAFWYGDGATQQVAIDQALSRCEKGDTNCTPHIWVKNGWLAIAEGTDQQGNIGYAIGVGHTKPEAVADANQVCGSEPDPFTDCKEFDTRRTGAFVDANPTESGAI